MSATHFTSQDFDSQVLKSEKPVLVDFFAEWCGPCLAAAPIIDRLSEEYKDQIVMGKLDIDQHNDIAQQYGVMSIPTMIIFKDGKEVERKVGFPGEQGLRNLVTKYTA